MTIYWIIDLRLVSGVRVLLTETEATFDINASSEQTDPLRLLDGTSWSVMLKILLLN